MASNDEPMRVRVVPRIGDIDAAAWDACAGDDDPFVSHAFLELCEASGSAAPEEGWVPQHLAVEDPSGQVVGCAPVYVKGHSFGEYVFDWSWANAAERAGIRYYPKLQCCVPFTPVPGPRLMVRPGAGDDVRKMLVAAMVELTRRHELSSLHITFCTAEEQRDCEALGMSLRTGVQYHWHNQGYASFDDFLETLISRKRKAIKKERRRALEGGIEVRALRGKEIERRHRDALYRFYRSTTGRKWGSAYLTRAFFDNLVPMLGDRVILTVAEQGGELVAGALHLAGKHALYGRYWGCAGSWPLLHFELCYHRAIELAIELGLQRVEAGAQGQHKIQRGYVPVKTYSAHYLAHAGLRDAVDAFLVHERTGVDREIEMLSAESPYHADRAAARQTPGDGGLGLG